MSTKHPHNTEKGATQRALPQALDGAHCSGGRGLATSSGECCRDTITSKKSINEWPRWTWMAGPTNSRNASMQSHCEMASTGSGFDIENVVNVSS